MVNMHSFVKANNLNANIKSLSKELKISKLIFKSNARPLQSSNPLLLEKFD